MFSDRLKEARKNSGLSQEKLGQLMGLKKQTISDYERGYSEPDMAKVAMFMSILGVDANFLWQDEMKAAQEPRLSSEALSVARAYDHISDYGKAIIDTVIRQEQRNNVRLREVKVFSAAHDSDVYAQYHAKQELEELRKEEAIEKQKEQIND